MKDPGHMPSGRFRAKWSVAGFIIVVALCTPVRLAPAPMPQEHFESIPVEVSECLDSNVYHSNLSFSRDGRFVHWIFGIYSPKVRRWPSYRGRWGLFSARRC